MSSPLKRVPCCRRTLRSFPQRRATHLRPHRLRPGPFRPRQSALEGPGAAGGHGSVESGKPNERLDAGELLERRRPVAPEPICSRVPEYQITKRYFSTFNIIFNVQLVVPFWSYNYGSLMPASDMSRTLDASTLTADESLAGRDLRGWPCVCFSAPPSMRPPPARTCSWPRPRCRRGRCTRRRAAGTPPC